jgi:hypothetical protein
MIFSSFRVGTQHRVLCLHRSSRGVTEEELSPPVGKLVALFRCVCVNHTYMYRFSPRVKRCKKRDDILESAVRSCGVYIKRKTVVRLCLWMGKKKWREVIVRSFSRFWNI